LYDLEISIFEPVFFVLNHDPEKRKFIKRYGPMLYAPLVYAVLLYATVVQRYKYRGQKLYADHLLPLIIPLLLWLFTASSTAHVVGLTMAVHATCSFYFYLVGFTAAHHHPDTARDGDILHDDMDWGVYQMSTVAERSEVNGWQFLTQTHFGEHILHHLCPTLDHGLLPQLKPILEATCKEFGIEMAQMPWWQHVVGYFRQLARLEVNDFSKKKR
jgi:fatty acid desaturase